MIDIKHLLKVSSTWASVVYVICYVGVMIYPPLRTLFVQYALHTNTTISAEFLGASYFISGLIIWNVVAVAGAGSFAYLFNVIKK